MFSFSDGCNSMQGDTLKHYATQNVLNCGSEDGGNCNYGCNCEGNCNDGCNCVSCQLDQEQPKQPSQEIIRKWTWSDSPSKQGLQDCLNSLVCEQWDLCESAAGSTLSSLRLSQRLVVMQRFLTALKRATSANQTPEPKPTNQIPRRPDNDSIPKVDRATHGLARVGSRAALSFAFAFLRRAWRSGEDQDLCSELLFESLEALRSLPEASLFQSDSVSKVWIDVVDRADKFLKQVVAGDVAGRGGPLPPLDDRYTALALLLELDIQKASLSGLLCNVMLLLNLWNSNNTNNTNNQAQRNCVASNSAPLLPVLRRFQSIQVGVYIFPKIIIFFPPPLFFVRNFFPPNISFFSPQA